MTTLGIIGAGNIGSTLARLGVAAGYDVVLANSRGPESLIDLVADIGNTARPGTVEGAATEGDVVVVTIPLHAIGSVPADLLAGKVVIDTCNYYPERDGAVPSLDDESTTTSELLQAHLPDSHVVKAFNNIFFRHLLSLARPTDDPERSVLPIAGDDAEAKATAARVLDDLGYDALDVGPLAEGWRYQRDLPAYAGIFAPDGDWDAPRPVDRALLEQRLAEARRYREV